MPDNKVNPYVQSHFDALSTGVEWVDPARAKFLRVTCHFEWQRPISQGNVTRLAAELQKGWFVSGTPLFMAVLPDNSMRLLNGNHTLEAIAASGISIPLCIIYRRVRDIKEAGSIYAVMDLQKIRTWRDAWQATGREDFPMASHVLPAMGMILSQFKYDPHATEINTSRHLRLQAMDDYKTAASIVQDALVGVTGVNRRLIQRRAIFAVALETARYQPSTAHAFWRGMGLDDALAAVDPRKALLRYAANNPVNGTNTNYTQGVAASLAWNAYFAREELSVCKPLQARGFKLLGTPWSGVKQQSSIDTGLMVGPGGVTKAARFNGGSDAN